MSDTVFRKVDFPLNALVSQIESGHLGLPDIQRPFVWKNAKVRNLFDSMYRGYPVGYFLFWENGEPAGHKGIGTNNKQLTPSLLIVDGQQRLTSLYAVLKGIPVVRENYESEKIEIAFNPLEEKFEVADAAIRKDRAFIPDISAVWNPKTDLFEFAENFVLTLRSAREVSDEEVKKIRSSLSKLSSLTHYPFTALQLTAAVDETQVSEVFVRINSEGKKLNQSDFILTLMSVFWDEGRAQLEEFCRTARVPTAGTASPFNHFIAPDPDQMLRVSIGLGFRRAKLTTVYSILRGKDLDTGAFSAERRISQFEILKQAQAKVLNLQYWHDFLKALVLAGYRSERMISSQAAVIFSYVLYLIGRTVYAVDEFKLRQLIAQWFFMSSLTGRYTSSSESAMEFDLASLRGVDTAAAFIEVLQKVSANRLTSDFWSINLPTQLATSAARSPALFSYISALNLLKARVLFSQHFVADLMDPALNANRSSLERHHLFPKNYLKKQGVTDKRELNQIANFTVVEWGDNSSISDKAPSEYYKELSTRFSTKNLKDMSYWHALPDGWQEMPYLEFLQKRRELMAEVIREGYHSIAGADTFQADDKPMSVEEIVRSGEGIAIEFKSTLRVNLHTGSPDPKMEHSCLKTITGFLNGAGGSLVIGVTDDGSAVGIDVDKFPNEDKMSLHLVNLLKERIGPQHMIYVHTHFDDYEDKRVMRIDCQPSKAPIYMKDSNTERFYVRTGPSTTELLPSQIQDYIKQRFA